MTLYSTTKRKLRTLVEDTVEMEDGSKILYRVSEYAGNKHVRLTSLIFPKMKTRLRFDDILRGA